VSPQIDAGDGFTVSHRVPPLPRHLNTKPQRGTCRWCGKPVSDRTPIRGLLKYWHDQCLEEYQIILYHDIARVALERRRGRKCAICGATRCRLEVDHIVPLESAPRDIRYWTLDNLQLLCHDCHRLKTIVDNRNHRQRRKLPPLQLVATEDEMFPLFGRKR